ncbi:MAG TPA: AAA family ATPase [Chloroflexia bacterium]
MSSLFQPAAKTQRYLKVLLHGVPGTGKTVAALSFPGPLAVIDLEGGTALYDGDWAVLRTKDLRKIEAAIDELGRSQTYHTVVVDPLTVLWQVLQDAGQGLVDKRRGDSLESGQALSPREWGIIKRRYNSILTRLINLPLHVVLIARDTDLYEGKGDALTKVGTKADVEKSTAYVADFVLWCQATGGEGRAQFSAVVEKSRSPLLPIGQRLTGYAADPTTGLYAKHFAAIAGAHTTGQRVALDEDAAVHDANTAMLEADMQPTHPPPQTRPTVDPALVAAGNHYRKMAAQAGLATREEQDAFAKQKYPDRGLSTLTIAEWNKLAADCRSMFAPDEAA